MRSSVVSRFLVETESSLHCFAPCWRPCCMWRSRASTVWSFHCVSTPPPSLFLQTARKGVLGRQRRDRPRNGVPDGEGCCCRGGLRFSVRRRHRGTSRRPRISRIGRPSCAGRDQTGAGHSAQLDRGDAGRRPSSWPGRAEAECSAGGGGSGLAF